MGWEKLSLGVSNIYISSFILDGELVGVNFIIKNNYQDIKINKSWPPWTNGYKVS